MSRTARLLSLMELLRTYRRPVTADILAEKMGVTVRTIYRDIAILQEQGAMIEGEAGIGYILKPGFTLPPLMFSPQEIEALVLGCEWVAERADTALGIAAEQALAKIQGVLPSHLITHIHQSPHRMGPGFLPSLEDDSQLPPLRQAIQDQKKITIIYEDAKGDRTTRTLYPLLLGYFDGAVVLVAWCEKRDDFRHFRLDRILNITFHDERYPGRRSEYLYQWRQQEGIPER